MGLNGARKTLASYLTRPAVHLLVRTSVTPNALSVLGFLLSAVTAVLVAFGYQLAAGFIMLLGGYFDIVDGAVARQKGQTTRFGAVLDSTLDRLSESVVLLGIMVLFLFSGEQHLFSLIGREWSVFIVGSALLSFPLVSHVRAKAEALGIDCTTGIFTRTERVILLTLGLWINQLVIILCVIVVLSLVTAVQRLLRVRSVERNKQPH